MHSLRLNWEKQTAAHISRKFLKQPSSSAADFFVSLVSTILRTLRRFRPTELCLLKDTGLGKIASLGIRENILTKALGYLLCSRFIRLRNRQLRILPFQRRTITRSCHERNQAEPKHHGANSSSVFRQSSELTHHRTGHHRYHSSWDHLHITRGRASIRWVSNSQARRKGPRVLASPTLVMDVQTASRPHQGKADRQ